MSLSDYKPKFENFFMRKFFNRNISVELTPLAPILALRSSVTRSPTQRVYIRRFFEYRRRVSVGGGIRSFAAGLRRPTGARR